MSRKLRKLETHFRKPKWVSALTCLGRATCWAQTHGAHGTGRILSPRTTTLLGRQLTCRQILLSSPLSAEASAEASTEDSAGCFPRKRRPKETIS